MIGKLVVVWPLSRPFWSARPVTPLPAVQPDIGLSVEGLEKFQTSVGLGRFRLADDFLMAVCLKRSMRRVTLGGRLHEVSASSAHKVNPAAKARGSIGISIDFEKL